MDNDYDFFDYDDYEARISTQANAKEQKAEEQAAVRAAIAASRNEKARRSYRDPVKLRWELVLELMERVYSLAGDYDTFDVWEAQMYRCLDDHTLFTSDTAKAMCVRLIEIAKQTELDNHPEINEILVTCRVLFATIVELDTTAEQLWGKEWMVPQYAWKSTLGRFE